MTDIYDAIARGFRYPPRSEEFWDEELDDDYDEVPPAPLPLDAAQHASLGRAVGEGLRAQGCDNTLRAARAWARRERVRWTVLRAALEDRGGFCDCEVVMNVLASPG